MQSIAQGQQADAAANAAKAAGTAQKSTPANTSNLNPGGTPAAAGVNSGPASTLLTGAGGVPNSALNLGGASGLGANTLLGS
jgi:predicted ATP-dependent serine protease